MQYTYTCSRDHEPYTINIEASTDDEAVEKILEQCGLHNKQVHAEMSNSSPQEMSDLIRTNMTKTV